MYLHKTQLHTTTYKPTRVTLQGSQVERYQDPHIPFIHTAYKHHYNDTTDFQRTYSKNPQGAERNLYTFVEPTHSLRTKAATHSLIHTTSRLTQAQNKHTLTFASSQVIRKVRNTRRYPL